MEPFLTPLVLLLVLVVSLALAPRATVGVLGAVLRGFVSLLLDGIGLLLTWI